MVMGSDNHNIKAYVLKVANWIRCDPTFQGLRQILIEPEYRVYRGDTPPILSRVSENKTKYVNRVEIGKISGSTLAEVWFECNLPLNPGLIAIIGNKGSGKSALSDILGLVAETRQSDSFSFLNCSKFRQPKNNKARHFEAKLTWENGSQPTKSLDGRTDPSALESVKYILQNYLETVWIELRGGGETRFDQEEKGVIFSHVPEASRIKAESLDDLIEYRTKESYQFIDLLRAELHSINQEIVAYEKMLTPAFRRSLEAQLAEKKRELDAHLTDQPAPIQKPELDTLKQQETARLSREIEEQRAKLAGLIGEQQKLAEEQKLLTRRSAVTSKLVSKIENFRKQHKLFLSDVTAECLELNLAIEELVKVEINVAPLSELQQGAASRITTRSCFNWIARLPAHSHPNSPLCANKSES